MRGVRRVIPKRKLQKLEKVHETTETIVKNYRGQINLRQEKLKAKKNRYFSDDSKMMLQKRQGEVQLSSKITGFYY